MGKSGICKLSTLAILPGDVSNTSLSNCGNMRPHVTANPSSNSSIEKVTVTIQLFQRKGLLELRQNEKEMGV